MPSHRRTRFPWLVLLGAVLAVPVMLVGDRAFGWLLAGPQSIQVGDAMWIWLPGTTSWSGPTAFVALSDVELDAKPEAATLSVLADEEYVLYLNGELVGAGRYRPEAGLDVYAVGPILEAGNNRLLVELRSGRGVGGFIASLDVTFADGRSRRFGTDGEWQVSRRFPRRLARADVPAGQLSGARVLGPPPFGRWGPRFAAAPRSTLLGVAHAGPRRWERVYWADAQGEWKRGSILRPVYNDRILIDFGEEMTGFLVLASAVEEPRNALVYVGLEMPEPERMSPAAVWIPIDGTDYWLDSEPRRFRYVLVLGAGGIRSAEVYGLRDEALESWPLIHAANGGVFGLAPVRLRTPVENEIWRELQGLSHD